MLLATTLSLNITRVWKSTDMDLNLDSGFDSLLRLYEPQSHHLQPKINNISPHY